MLVSFVPAIPRVENMSDLAGTPLRIKCAMPCITQEMPWVVFPLLMMFCRTWALSKGFSPRGLLSISSSSAAMAPWVNKRLCTVKAVSTKLALTGSRPLAVLTTAYAAAMAAAVPELGPCACVCRSRKRTTS